MASHLPAVSTINMLSKVGADLRWFLEREGVDPEQCVVSIGVPNEAAKGRIVTAMLRDFVPGRMRRVDTEPALVVAHGVPLLVMAKKELA